ncbi:hypothetical protein [Stenotrophomonas maltophilia]|uniref:hypothetical protein n=1 Tax=Stenotrophomonas maltophilia TaxID=40324 RepID=UPI003451F22C
MTTDNKTLADVQPGGRVRLGDQALSTGELRRNAHVLVLQEMRTRFTDAGSPSRTAALDAAIAALSAQPSPGGQGAPRCAEHCQNGFADICLASQRDGVICPEDSCDIDDGIRHNHLAARQPVGEPVPMVLHCPRCHVQHIDAPDERTPGWKNPPHRSHLCHGCGLIWRPADVPTIGVERTQTTGKNDTPFTTPPAQAVDLGQFRDAVMHAYGVIEPEDYCVKLGELLDLIDGNAAGNGKSVRMADLEQILLDPENQPSQFGTVPTELLEKCEEMISDLVHQFGDRGCTCTFPEAGCCAYARAENYSRDGAAHV